MTEDEYRALAHAYQPRTVEFCRRLLQAPSPSGQEGEVAGLCLDEMRALGYEDVTSDEVGNVIGLIPGRDRTRSIMFNSHLDCVPEGDPAAWRHGPFSGDLDAEGYLWGRGASDTKGALAAMIVALGALRQVGWQPPCDLYLCGVVMEENAGHGTDHLLTHLRTDCCVLGEATSNQLRRGHRGRLGITVKITGRAAHASAPARGINPHYSLARFVLGLEGLPLPWAEGLGYATIAPTALTLSPNGHNVIPGEATLTVDWRNLPSEDIEGILADLRNLLNASLGEGATGTVELLEYHPTTWTGKPVTVQAGAYPYLLAPDDPLVTASQSVLEGALGRPVGVDVWGFATDGGRLMRAGVPTIGFSPCEEQYAHTTEDKVSVALLEESVAGYLALAMELGEKL